jgi:uncharacterized CHY-type Zn-finger protein
MLKALLFFSLAVLIIGCKEQKNQSDADAVDTLAHARTIGGVLVKGKVIDNQTRCSHWHSDLDIIALKFKCCDTYYPCYSCHAEDVDHEATTWEIVERDQKAILCGVCGTELTINEYMGSNNICPNCQSLFNPNCKKHYDLYFTMDSLTTEAQRNFKQ